MLKIFRYIVQIFLDIFPRNSELWVIGGWYGTKYSDNSKYLFEYIVNQDEVTIYWVAKKRSLVKTISEKGYPVLYCYSLKGILVQLLCGVAIVNQSTKSDLQEYFIANKVKKIQLWHGIPMKKIGFDARVRSSCSFSILDSIKLLVQDNYQLIISCGEESTKKFTSAFRCNPSSVIATGFPRNIVFNKKGVVGEHKFSCIYMPTFRGSIGSEFELLSMADLITLEKEIIINNVHFAFRLHPVNHFSCDVMEYINSSEYLSINTDDDIYTSINNYDCLVTDFSSIYFDFLLSGKPIVFAPFDKTEYLTQDRELYYEYEAVTIPPYCKSWKSLINRVISIKNEGVSLNYIDEYSGLLAKFHNVRDENYCENVYSEIKKVL